MARKRKPTIADIRVAFARYVKSEGCSCCRGSSHDADYDTLAKMLNFPIVKNGRDENVDWYDWSAVLEESDPTT